MNLNNPKINVDQKEFNNILPTSQRNKSYHNSKELKNEPKSITLEGKTIFQETEKEKQLTRRDASKIPLFEKFPFLKNAPRQQKTASVDNLCVKPMGVVIRNVMCYKCKKFGHEASDKECPLFGVPDPEREEFHLRINDPLNLIHDMQKSKIRKTSRIVKLGNFDMSTKPNNPIERFELKPNFRPYGDRSLNIGNQEILIDNPNLRLDLNKFSKQEVSLLSNITETTKEKIFKYFEKEQKLKSGSKKKNHKDSKNKKKKKRKRKRKRKRRKTKIERGREVEGERVKQKVKKRKEKREELIILNIFLSKKNHIYFQTHTKTINIIVLLAIKRNIFKEEEKDEDEEKDEEGEEEEEEEEEKEEEEEE
ncbi:cbf1 interacting corepressor cir [Anaeramoeba flamelloides]|uniref:Cbf1 interacting corepressor cir n=1 Tax=Anaeramoeba flamelloides TaxID=1746091 RepID=A0ABQ8Y0U2_9EUKA|nr:cbf1 interacting corepressor cir [Anaeramoeba flamelloides]